MPKDHPTETWTRPARPGRTHTTRLADQAAAGTRLDIARAFADADGVAEPTRPIPVVPMPDRRAQPPVVTPIPAARRRESAPPPPAPSAPPMVPPAGGADPVADADEARLTPEDLGGMALINRVLDEQRELNAAHARRMDARADALHGIRRVGPWGLFGWRPLQGPNVHEVAQARQKAADAEERRRYAHQRRLDAHEEARAWVKLAILAGLFVLVVAAGYIAFMILTGAYTWAPTRVK